MTHAEHEPTTAGRRRRRARAVAVAAVCLATVGSGVVVAAPSVAASAGAVPAGRVAECLDRLDQRLGQVGRLQAIVSGDTHLSDAHRGALQSKLDGATAGLTALRARIVADTDRAAIVADCLEQATGYRVYALLSPQVHLTRAADREASIAAKVGQLAPRVQHVIDTAAAGGRDVSDARAALADLRARVAAATTKLDTMATAVLAITPAAFNADHSSLDAARSTAAGFRADLAAARADVRRIRVALRR